jgi:hypothetical protein
MDVDTKITRLLTLLNASAVKPGKRKRDLEEPSLPSEKLNKKRSVQFSEEPIEKNDTPRVQEVNKNIDDVLEEEVLEGGKHFVFPSFPNFSHL